MSAEAKGAQDPLKQILELQRDCSAVQIPYGNQVTLRAGTEVNVKQALGDTLTLQTTHGYLVRINVHDADALGLDPVALAPAGMSPPGDPSAKDLDAEVQESALWDIMKTCYDPEIPVNIVDLGLIYACRIQPGQAENLRGVRVEVDMTLTAPGCGMGEVLKDDVHRKLSQVPGVREVQVELVFDPAWAADMMSESARLELGMF